MDLLAALALVLVLEGLGLVIFARTLPELLAELERADGGLLRRIGFGALVSGVVLYLVIRGVPGGG